MALLALAMACSPVFNWREVPLDGQLTALLPCKPDRAQRSLAWDGDALQIEMVGCEAGGATFAVARLPGGNSAQAEARLATWRAAARAQWTQATLTEASVGPLRAASAPAPVDWQVRTVAASVASPDRSRPAEARMRWFAYADARGVFTLYQATVLGQPSAGEAGPTFFEGLRLR